MILSTQDLGRMIGRAVNRELRRTRRVRKSTPTPAQLFGQVAALRQRARLAELEAQALAAADPVSKATASSALTFERLRQAHGRGQI